ncbi:MAG: hypothetical protein HYX34_02300 [Actinobacteria bacterium]|nr:hypothetical protein [Actinomycetota bacterium]
MDVTATLDAPCPPSALFRWVDDLARYPRWLEIVTRADPDRTDPSTEAAPGSLATAGPAREAGPGADGAPAWRVDLRGRLGPVARTKRLRMVRTTHEPPHRVRFERQERDGRSHSAWVLTAEIRAVPAAAPAAAPAPAPTPGPVAGSEPAAGLVAGSEPAASRLDVHLHYGGSLWGPVLEHMLGAEIARSRDRLLALLDAPGAPA